MAFSFMSRNRNGYGNIYTPHAGSMIIQVQRETGLANRTIVISERQVALLRMLGSRIGIALVAFFVGTWLLFAVQTARVPALSGRITQLERENRRIDSLKVALARMHSRYEQVRQMLAAVGSSPAVARASGLSDARPRQARAPKRSVRSADPTARPDSIGGATVPQ